MEIRFYRRWSWPKVQEYVSNHYNKDLGHYETRSIGYMLHIGPFTFDNVYHGQRISKMGKVVPDIVEIEHEQKKAT